MATATKAVPPGPEHGSDLPNDLKLTRPNGPEARGA